MESNQIYIILNETNVLFKNIQETFDSVSEHQMAKTILKWPLSRHFYHMLHSLDQWYINPNNYINPPFHEQGMNSFESVNTKLLKKSELFEYFVSIKERILKHINALTDKSLFEKPEGCDFTRLDLIIAQSRHLMYNIGLIHGMLQVESGKLQKYVGISEPINR